MRLRDAKKMNFDGEVKATAMVLPVSRLDANPKDSEKNLKTCVLIQFEKIH